ncbi:MAG: AraC-like DNA-binding protein [Reinekea sp.]|jgi:AraC-like DNA-binding protein
MSALLTSRFFQRTFKKLLVATPKQYRQSLLSQQIDTGGGK